MCKINKKWGDTRQDPCMKKIVWLINNCTNYKTLACCCGHGNYPMTIVVTRGYGEPLEYFSQVFIPRKRRFYVRDRWGRYHIPEVTSLMKKKRRRK